MSDIQVTKAMLGDLMDGRLEDDYVQRMQRMQRKDTTRLETYLEVLQERARWPNKILLRLTDHLYVVRNETGAGRLIKCDCGHEFGDYRTNWKLGCRVRVRRTREEFEQVYSPAYAIPEPEWMTIRQYYCPGCVTQLAVEVVPPGYPPLFDMLPDLDTLYRDYLGKPLADESPDWFRDRTNELTAQWLKETSDV
jgi:acetone carboxylase, gamma subunit